MAQTVLEVFKKFDADDSGAISRTELGEVLQALKETDPWDDEDIDEILATADASGDGELQIEEFVKWVFAEDKEISQGIKPKATVKISGCSRDEFNGNYVQKEGEYYYRRPIFYCEEKKKFLFYHGERGQWQLYWRTGPKASCRIKTTRTAHMPGEGKTWAVYKQKSSKSKKKKMVREPDMKCEAEVAEVPDQQENAEELLLQAEPCVKFDEIYYKKVDGEVIGNRAVYRQSKGDDDWGDTYLFYDKPETKWKRANEAAEGAVALNKSRITKVPSPEKAAWFDDHGKMDVNAVDTDGIPNSTGQSLTLNHSVQEGWKDETFPHNKDSVGQRCSEKLGRMRWLRAMALHENPVLFADVEPADALQGSLGNCWLIAAMAAIAEFPSYMKKNIFQNKKLAKDGKYHIKLFDGRYSRWKVVTVDDYLPCSAWGGDSPSLFFAKINDGKLCLALIEKAFAKLYGSYSGLWSGFQPVAWYHLTGCDNFFRYKFTYEVAARWEVNADVAVYSDKRRTKKLGVLAQGAHFREAQRVGSWVKISKEDGDGPSSGWISYYDKGKRVASRSPLYPPRYFFQHMQINGSAVMEANGTDHSVADWSKSFYTKSSAFASTESVWQDLLKFDKDNHLMAAVCTQSNDESDSGLVHGHAYSVLKVVEIDGVKLVACRNPWGTDAEWNGPWSDRSSEWRCNPSIAKALNVDFQLEGTFWMDYEDWMYCMGNIKVMNCKMPTSRGDFHSRLLDDDEDGGSGDDGGEFNDEDDEDDSFGGRGDIWISPPRTGGKIVACYGLGVNWNGPVLMGEGTLLQPGDTDQTFMNVPSMLDGATYFGHPINVSAGFWTIEFEPPTTLYVWVMDGCSDSLELVGPTTGWTLEDAPGFQTNDGYKLHLMSKYVEKLDRYTGCYEGFRTISSSFCGGLIGVYPLPKQPEVLVSAACASMPSNDAPVTFCSGLEVEWNSPMKMEEGTQTNPGEEEHVFQNVPGVLLGGTYIGSKCWPSAGTWTIDYQAPCKLYVWAREGEYNAGVNDLLSADGWAREAAEGFQRSDGKELHLWSRHFMEGTSYSITVESCFVGGVVGQPLDLGGAVTCCSGLDVEWNSPHLMSEGTLVNPGDRDYIFKFLPPFLSGGTYIGSRTWPQAGTWTIEYKAPTILYVWAEKGQYNAGVDDALSADGWVREEEGQFMRWNSRGNNPLCIWSRHFQTGSSYSIQTNGLVVAGVVSAPADE